MFELESRLSGVMTPTGIVPYFGIRIKDPIFIAKDLWLTYLGILWLGLTLFLLYSFTDRLLHERLPAGHGLQMDFQQKEGGLLTNTFSV